MKKEDELVDLVDTSGVIQKTGIPRADVDRYPRFHMQIVIGVIFDSQDRILVHKRAHTKKVNPGDIDHVCGGIAAGETPEEALIRESLEETGIQPTNLQVVTKGINKYNRYRYLLIGEADREPGDIDASEVEWVQYMKLDELRSKHFSGEFSFVDEFFEDTDRALKSRRVHS